MLRQLIEVEANQLADFEVDIQRLTQRAAQCKQRHDRYVAMLTELEQRVRENP